MSANLESAFGILRLAEMPMRITRRGVTGEEDIMVAPSNYYRNSASVEDMTTQGREYIIRKSELAKTSLTKLRRGDALISDDLGEKSIVEVREMIALGNILGWRVRVDG